MMATPIPSLPNIPNIPGLGGGANKYASGNKSYGPGRIGAATTGAVDKTGYLDRDRRKKIRQLAMRNAAFPAQTPDTLGAVTNR